VDVKRLIKEVYGVIPGELSKGSVYDTLELLLITKAFRDIGKDIRKIFSKHSVTEEEAIDRLFELGSKVRKGLRERLPELLKSEEIDYSHLDEFVTDVLTDSWDSCVEKSSSLDRLVTFISERDFSKVDVIRASILEGSRSIYNAKFSYEGVSIEATLTKEGNRTEIECKYPSRAKGEELEELYDLETIFESFFADDPYFKAVEEQNLCTE
jgi:hypothetical protein